MSFLDEVIPEIRRSLEDSRYFSGLPARTSRRPTSLRRAIERDRESGALIVEYKRVSPGQLEPELPSRRIPEFLELTRHAPVTAYSCLATEPRFRGAPQDVAELVQATERPVLFKDIVIDTRQVEAAARSGASAILLIARLDQAGRPVESLSSLAEVAHRLGLEVLLEFHHRSELSRGADVAADVYGVNARDLDTLTLDRATGITTLREARDRGLQPLLGLSGVENSADARRFWDAGADGILVGTAVARAPRPAEFLSSLLRDVSGGSG